MSDNNKLKQAVAYLIDALKYHIEAEKRGYSREQIDEKIKYSSELLLESVEIDVEKDKQASKLLKTLDLVLVKNSATMGTPGIADELASIYEKNKNRAIETIQKIRNGAGVDRTKFPEDMKGEIAKTGWNEGLFTLGIEYGYMIALMDAFEITKDDIKGGKEWIEIMNTTN